MLTEIHIRDLALVKHLELSLNQGMTVLTGETGAGKSILIDAMNLALGQRADTSIIRTGAKKAEIALHFEMQSRANVQDWLCQYDLDTPEQECVLRRIVQTDGRSKAYINGHPVPLQRLRELGAKLVEIHGQHGYQFLMQKENHLKILDSYANTKRLTTSVKHAYKRWADTETALKTLKLSLEERQSRMDYLQFQIDELTALSLEEHEWEVLTKKQKQLALSETIINHANHLLMLLAESDANTVAHSLNHAEHTISQLEELDDAFTAIRPYIEQASIQVSEAVVELKEQVSSIDTDQTKLHEIEARISEIFDLARKHRTEPEQLNDVLINYQQEWQELNAHEESIETLEHELLKWQADYHLHAKKLSQTRNKQAGSLSKIITQHCKALGMPQAELVVELSSDDTLMSATGYDKATLLFAPNPGIGFSPLNKTASGGELSRVSLAIELANQRNNKMPVLIFDEVDTGIGGSVAEIVGRCLHTLSEDTQVLCVTHLAQVAAHATQHCFIKKESKKGQTETSVTELDEKAVIKELARMLGGVKITDKTLAHAKEMRNKTLELESS